MAPGRAPHVFQCLDSHVETKYEIKVYVREWNTLWDFEKLFKEEAVQGINHDIIISPDVEGRENNHPRRRTYTEQLFPFGCPNENGGTSNNFNDYCDDYRDLERQRKQYYNPSSEPQKKFPNIEY